METATVLMKEKKNLGRAVRTARACVCLRENVLAPSEKRRKYVNTLREKTV